MDMFPYKVNGLGALAIFNAKSSGSTTSSGGAFSNIISAAKKAVSTATNSAKVYAEKAASGLTVRWQYAGATPDYFYVQLYRNGSFKGNTKVAANLRSYNYTTENPSSSNRLYFKVYAQVPGSGLVLVGQSEEYSSLGASSISAAVSAAVTAMQATTATPPPTAAPAPQPTSQATVVATGTSLPYSQTQQQTTAVMTYSNPNADSEVIKELNKISNEYLELPLTPAMQEEYLLKYNQYRGTGMAAAQALARIEQEFAEALENEDIAFYESRTGDIITGEGYEEDIDPELLPYVQKTGGASGSTTNLLIYGGIAAAGLFLLFGNKKKGKGLSGTAKKRKTQRRKTRASKKK